MSALNSWGVYLVASAALIGVMAPQLASVASLSREGADWRSADGVAVALDSLRPGVTLAITFGGWPSNDAIVLGGHRVSISYGNGTFDLASRLPLPNMTLTPFTSYRAWLSGGDVEVEQDG